MFTKDLAKLDGLLYSDKAINDKNILIISCDINKKYIIVLKKLDYFETAVVTTWNRVLERESTTNQTFEMIEVNMIYGVQLIILVN